MIDAELIARLRNDTLQEDEVRANAKEAAVALEAAQTQAIAIHAVVHNMSANWPGLETDSWTLGRVKWLVAELTRLHGNCAKSQSEVQQSDEYCEAIELSFEEIEDCFPDGGLDAVDAQWLHNFARAIIAAINAKGAK